MPKITFENLGEGFDVEANTSILECAIQNNLPLDHDCGGNCACTTCCVHIVSGMENLSAMSDDEQSLLEANDKMEEGARLGCQSRILSGEVKLQIPD